MKTISLSAAIGALTIIASTSINIAEAKKCQAKAFFSRDQAYHSGIVFVHGSKTHHVEYGTFQGGINYTDVKTPMLNNDTVGLDKNASAYGWGSVSEFGFLGNAQDYLFGLQMAMGSIAGLMTPEVEAQIRNALKDQDTGNAAPGSAFSALQAKNGAALNAGIQAVVNSTQTRITEAKAALAKKKKAAAKSKKSGSKDKKSSKSKRDLEERDDDNEDCSEDNVKVDSSKASVKATSANNDASKSDSSADDDDNDDNEEDDSDDNDNGSAFTNPPSVAAVYRPPWGSARPVYFYGQCDHCDKSTGYTSSGHGLFQSCTLIYQGKEYNGTVSSDKTKHMCNIDFECQ